MVQQLDKEDATKVAFARKLAENAGCGAAQRVREIGRIGQIDDECKAVDNNDKTPTYGLLNMQITREFRLFSIYIGGENLTNYKQKNPIMGADTPWGTNFDATQIWAPTDGIMGYIGLRFKFNKY